MEITHIFKSNLKFFNGLEFQTVMHMFGRMSSEIVCIPSHLLTLQGYNNGPALVFRQDTQKETIKDFERKSCNY